MSKRYKNPPLEEALVEFRFRTGTTWDQTIPGLVYQQLQHHFDKPTHDTRVGFNLEINPVEGSAWFHTEKRVIFKHKTHNILLQVGARVLAINNLKPYIGWETFLPIIRESYQAYTACLEHFDLEQLTVRYINKIDIKNINVISDYFTLYPSYKELPFDQIKGFILGLVFPLSTDLENIRIELRNIQSNSEELVSFLFDLECVHKNPSFSIEENVIDWLSDAHSHVEEIFEKSLTDNTKHSFMKE